MLHQCQQYQQVSSMVTRQGGSGRRNVETDPRETSVKANEQRVAPSTNSSTPSTTRRQVKCWNCNRNGHLAKDCPKPKRESTGHPKQTTSTRTVKSDTRDNPMNYLLFDSDVEHSDVNMIHVVDQGSRPQRDKVIVGGVPLIGIVDSGADITIMGGTAFKQVASVAKLRKRDFKQPDKIPRNYV